MYIAVSRSSISILVTRFLGVSRSRIRCCCCSLRVWLSQSVVVYSRAAGRCLRCEAMNFSWILIRDFSPPSSVQIASALPLLVRAEMREQLLRLFCLAMGLRLFACLVLGLGSGMQSWGSRSWRRFAELKNATSNGSSCVLLYLLLLLLLRGWLGISSSQRGGPGSVGGCWCLFFTLFTRFFFVLLLRVTVWHLFLLPLSFSHTLSLSLALFPLSAQALGDGSFCRQMAALVRCWLVSWLTENMLCVNSAFTVNC